ncbi:MAG: 1,4-dihydroxy-2-naphthoate octaprenyltransferase [Ignavibacteriae bacterium HGW-Ignavibacteriae-4]|jgi:1,4-dihydroxy-2-naphthoate octaprenyltransferase|nr:MAG: 1,4-dihydroxy-2-naphthoate octaprenyltransferase [Ignavibacteriae bacterium HGW-Ignavibacteriae-4]
MTTVQSRSKASLMMQAVRPFSFSASVVPVLVGAMFALAYFEGEILWYLFPVILIASILLHAGTNLVSEYFDLKKGVDKKETFGSSKVLVEELLSPKTVLRAGYISFALGFLLGMILVYVHGLPILYLGLIGIAGGIFYTGKPIGYKYIAMGDILVFFLMGPFMVVGTFFSLTGVFDWNVAIVSLPIGFLVTAILNANNIRDIKHDTEAKVKTFATILGINAAKKEYYFLVFGAYLSVIIMVLTGLLHFWTLLIIISLPVALKNIKDISIAEVNNPEAVAMMDIRTAQLHMQFGLLLTIGLVLTAIL